MSIELQPGSESKLWYQRAWDLLDDYKQKSFTVTISHGKKRVYDGIEIFASALTIEEKAEHIRSLLAGMGFTVDFNKNNETIYIK